MTDGQVREKTVAPLPLRGVRVTDFTWIGAGSYTTKLLADQGAEVIKIESSASIDSLRLAPPFKEGIKGINRSGYFSDRNTSKRSMLLNLKQPGARDIALRLIAQSDVVANNFTPGTMERLGLGYEEVCKVRPDIIYLSMSVHGSSGPEHRSPGYGATVIAISGLYNLSGTPDRQPTGTGTNYPDHIPCPTHAAFAILAALRRRRRTGRGQRIDIAETEATIALLGPTVLDYTVNGRVQGRQGNRVPTAAPNGVYPCRGGDRWIAISVETEAQWVALAEELGAPEWVDGERFGSLLARHHHHEELDLAIAQKTRDRDPYELMQRLQGLGVPAGVVQTAKDMIENDPQMRHRGHWVSLMHPEMGRSIYNAPPFRLDPGPEKLLLEPAPLFGQHTREICSDLLGMTEQEIDRLIQEGVLA